MDPQHHGGDVELRRTGIGGRSAAVLAEALRARVPARPAVSCRSRMRLQTVRTARRVRAWRRFGAAPKSEPEHARARQLTGQRDVAGPRKVIIPGQRAIAVKILPAIARAHVAGAGTGRGRHSGPVTAASSARENGPCLAAAAPGARGLQDAPTLPSAGAPQVRREQRVGTKRPHRRRERPPSAARRAASHGHDSKRDSKRRGGGPHVRRRAGAAS